MYFKGKAWFACYAFPENLDKAYQSLQDAEEWKQLESLSKKFGEVQFFCTHRAVEVHCWVKAVKGRIVRAYSYIRESGRTLLNEGEPTTVEQPYRLIDTNLPEAQDDDYWEREDIITPNEELIMKIAESWSIDPMELENREEISNSALLGEKTHPILRIIFR